MATNQQVNNWEMRPSSPFSRATRFHNSSFVSNSNFEANNMDPTSTGYRRGSAPTMQHSRSSTYLESAPYAHDYYSNYPPQANLGTEPPTSWRHEHQRGIAPAFDFNIRHSRSTGNLRDITDSNGFSKENSGAYGPLQIGLGSNLDRGTAASISGFSIYSGRGSANNSRRGSIASHRGADDDERDPYEPINYGKDPRHSIPTIEVSEHISDKGSERGGLKRISSDSSLETSVSGRAPNLEEDDRRSVPSDRSDSPTRDDSAFMSDLSAILEGRRKSAGDAYHETRPTPLISGAAQRRASAFNVSGERMRNDSSDRLSTRSASRNESNDRLSTTFGSRNRLPEGGSIVIPPGPVSRAGSPSVSRNVSRRGSPQNSKTGSATSLASHASRQINSSTGPHEYDNASGISFAVPSRRSSYTPSIRSAAAAAMSTPSGDVDDEEKKDEKEETDDRNDAEANENDMQTEDTKTPAHDCFPVVERQDPDYNLLVKRVLKTLRLFLYLLIFFLMLVGTVASRISMFALASDIGSNDMARAHSVVLLIVSIGFPMFYNFVVDLMKILFGARKWPSFGSFMWCVCVEMTIVFAQCFLIFRIIPSTDFFRGITITLATFQAPGILKMIMMERPTKSKVKPALHFILSFLALLVQLGAPAFLIITDDITTGPRSVLVNGTNVPPKEITIPRLTRYSWELVVFLILASLAPWENFISEKSCLLSCCGKTVQKSLKLYRKTLEETRHTRCVLISPFKMAVVVLCGRFLADSNFELFTWDDRAFSGGSEGIASYSLFLIIIGAAILCTYAGGLSCSLQMQRFAFTLPIVLSAPASLAVVYAQCRFKFLSDDWYKGMWYCPDIELEELYQPIAVACALWLSYCIVVSHIWTPGAERMAHTEKLFVGEQFSSVFPDLNLSSRRRRDDKDDITALKSDEKGQTPPKIFVCATLWHETQQEMTQLLKSLFRLDENQIASREFQRHSGVKDPDYFDMEIHIIFDDAFVLDQKKDRFVPNSWVCLFWDCMGDAARSVLKAQIEIPAPIKYTTPYGGRLEWTMPGETKLIVHLKDKNKIRHRKRWSQVMYLYYLLGFTLLGCGDDSSPQTEGAQAEANGSSAGTELRNRRRKRKNLRLRHLLNHFKEEEHEKIVDSSENTFILTLDGDVDFKPDSVKLLVDRMKRNKKVGAVCGRIHPIGSGPMVWYQMFEYGVSHWLQKAAEHVFGCVLCCPGCYSLFRASALMDENIIKVYTTKPTEARHFIQYEQGEDRWLCTLLLQQGYRIDYCAGADAWTFAPENFNEFFNQRRRWSPSTLANIMDLLGSWRTTVLVNNNISRLYILFQFVLMAASILAPSTIILMIADCYYTVLGLGHWESYLLSIAPVAFYIYICMTKKSKTQLKVGAVLAAAYTVVMMIASVGTIISLATEDFTSPNVLFLTGLFVIFLIAALLHPQEFDCLIFGALYFMMIPTTFILLTVFFLCNLNNVSWGTREVPKVKTAEEKAQEEAENERKRQEKKSKNLFSLAGISKLVGDIRDILQTVWASKKDGEQPSAGQGVQNGAQTTGKEPAAAQKAVKPKPVKVGKESDPSNPYWLTQTHVGQGEIKILEESEKKFWCYTIKKYLLPIDENKDEKEKIAKDLAETRDNVVFAYVLMNFLWSIITLQLQIEEDRLKNYYIAGQFEPLSMVFLGIFAIVLILQFIGMLVHRWGTFLHLMSSTRLGWAQTDEEYARDMVRNSQKEPEPQPDYGEDEDEELSSVITTHPGENGNLPANGQEVPRRHMFRRQQSRKRMYGDAYQAYYAENSRRQDLANQRTDPGQFPQLQGFYQKRYKNMDMNGTLRYRNHQYRYGDGGRYRDERRSSFWGNSAQRYTQHV